MVRLSPDADDGSGLFARSKELFPFRYTAREIVS
jgi:hypothetical protein